MGGLMAKAAVNRISSVHINPVQVTLPGDRRSGSPELIVPMNPKFVDVFLSIIPPHTWI